MAAVTFAQPFPVAWTVAGLSGLALAVFAYRFRHSILPPSLRGIDPSGPTVTIGGVPRAGKSTLFQNFSGKTGNLSIAKDTVDYVLSDGLPGGQEIQVYDLPGDCPREIAQKLRPATDTLVFVFDPSEDSYCTESQKRLLDSLEEELNPRITIPVINDKPEKDEVKLEDLQAVTSQDIPVVDVSEDADQVKKLLESQFSPPDEE